MVSRILIPALLGLAFTLPAAAATTSNNTTSQSSNSTAATSQNSANTTPRIAAKLRSNLQQAGFTDIRVVPQSFLVRAKDRQGNPAMMVVTPDSFTMVTAMDSSVNGGSQSATSNTNSGSGHHAPSSGSGNTVTTKE